MTPRPSLLPLQGLCGRCARPLRGSQWQHTAVSGRTTLHLTHLWMRSLALPILHSSRSPGCQTPLSRRGFHSSRRVHAEPTNHYETLGLTPDANQAEIKKAFYRLSKIHHPDHNPDDPTASSRFQRISSAYHVLGAPSKRQLYDRDMGYGPAYAGGRAEYAGSYSSAQRGQSSATSPNGARPASGLNKRRGTFRGPPPSFYASGGWGAHANKRRAAQQEGAAAGYRGTEKSSEGDSEPYAGNHSAAYGAGGATWGQGMPGDDVPHFDRQSHFERQEEMDERMARRGRARRLQQEREAEALQRDWAVRLVLVVIVVGLAGWIDVVFIRPPRQLGEAKRDRGK